MKRILLLSCFIFASIIANAQKGKAEYIITNANDTVYGNVSGGKGKVVNLTNAKGTKYKYKADDVKLYFNGHHKGESVAVSGLGHKIFLFLVSAGKINLYSTSPEAAGNHKSISLGGNVTLGGAPASPRSNNEAKHVYYVSRGNGEALKVTKQTKAMVDEKWLSDCPAFTEIYNSWNSTKRNDIKQTVILYNENCK